MKDKIKIDLEKEYAFLKEKESKCFNCGKNFGLQLMGKGIALCFWCRLKEKVGEYWNYQKNKK